MRFEWKKQRGKLRSFFFFFFCSMGSALALAGEIAVIANPSAPNMSKEDVKALFLGFKSTLPDGTPAEVLIPKGDGDVEKFIREVLGISKSEFKSHWLSKTLTGEALPPKELTPEEILNFVRTKKGAIGIIPKDMAKEGVKIILEVK